MENLWSIQEALTVPLLLKLKISEKLVKTFQLDSFLVQHLTKAKNNVITDFIH